MIDQERELHTRGIIKAMTQIWFILSTVNRYCVYAVAVGKRVGENLYIDRETDVCLPHQNTIPSRNASAFRIYQKCIAWLVFLVITRSRPRSRCRRRRGVFSLTLSSQHTGRGSRYLYRTNGPTVVSSAKQRDDAGAWH